ncbi:MAG: VWA domain-containing protein [Candidatus Sumerlaeota bacterium]|nr:VWA domain-containing protein [Candidatus Sumerlaeota bacterium]
MRYRYTQFDERFRQMERLEQLKNLFLQLLMHTGGNVGEALEWLDLLAKRYNLWGDDLDLEKFKQLLIDEGYLAPEGRPGRAGQGEGPPGALKPTAKAERAIRHDAFEDLFASLKQDAFGGEHVTPYAGRGGDRLPETRPYEFGDRVQDIDFVHSIANGIRHSGRGRFRMAEEDLEVFEVEQTTSCATVLALDVSHSMILYGEDRITPAKRVALALTELIQSRFQKDALDVIVFGDQAAIIDPARLPYIQVGPYHTNTKAALELAQRLLARRKHANKQIVLITDGKPSALTIGGRLYVNSYGLDARIVNKTVEEAQACRRKGIIITTFMIASDPYLQEFVDRLTEANKGRAYYADLQNLGKFVLVDYVRNRRKEI